MAAEQFLILLAVICLAPKLTDFGSLIMWSALMVSAAGWLAVSIAIRLLA